MTDIIVNGMAFSLPLFIIAVGGIYSERSGVTNLARSSARCSSR